MKRIAWLSMLVVLMVLALAGTGVAQQTGVTFKVEEPRLDLGDVKSGSEAVATFVFHNTGDADVRILKAKPS